MAEQKSITQDFATPYKFTGKELDEETGLYYFGARYYDPKSSIWLGVDPLAEKFPEWSPYSFCFNNPLRFTDPDGREPDDWIKNISTGEVKWFEGTGKVAERAAAQHWGLFDSKGKTENLGSSFFGTKTNNSLDNAQIRKEQSSYLQDVSSKINDKAGVKKDETFQNNIAFEFLSSKFLGTSFGNNSNKGSDLPGVIWDYGGADIVQDKMPKTILTKTLFRGIDLYLSSENMGVGSDRASHVRADAVNSFKTKTINYLDNETLFKISLHKL